MSSEGSLKAQSGIILIVSAPSGAGKTTLCKMLLAGATGFRNSISYTTRPPREGEQHGVDYCFVSRAEFDAMIADGAFVEWAEVHGNRYGTARATLLAAEERGENLLLEIDCQGAEQLRSQLPNAVYVFIVPPNFEELERRLRGRGTDTEAVIVERLRNAVTEISHAVWYDYLIVNDDLGQALVALQSVITAEKARAPRVLPGIANIFDLKLQNR